MFNSVKAVSYRVADLERAKNWYRQLLGKEPVFDSPMAVFFAVGGAVLSLVPAAESSRRGDEGVVAYWDVDDADAAHRRLMEAGATPRGEMMTTVLKSRAATVVDPFGNVVGVVSKPSEATRRSAEDQPSESALGVALFRAFAAEDERDQIRGPDYLAEVFLPEESRRMVKDPAARKWVIGKAPGSYEFFLARTTWFDSVVREAFEGNWPQIVFLGAGYDSRPYRLASLIQGTRIFELDAAPTQERKRRLLRQANVPVPAQVTFVPVNFTRDKLEDVLAKAGFDRNGKTLFVWEGVSYYLTAQAVDRTLEFVRSNSPAGSTVCFDYLADAPDMLERYGVKESVGLMRSTYHAEPVQFRIAEGTIEAFLEERGYRVVEHLTTEDLERKYLTLGDGSPAGKALASIRLVRAEFFVRP